MVTEDEAPPMLDVLRRALEALRNTPRDPKKYAADCVDCGGPRFVGSAARCSTCYTIKAHKRAVAERERIARRKEKTRP